MGLIIAGGSVSQTEGGRAILLSAGGSCLAYRGLTDTSKSTPYGTFKTCKRGEPPMSAKNFASSNTNLDADSTSRFASWGRGFTAERSEPNTSDMTNLSAPHRSPELRGCYSLVLDDRFRETGLDEASIHGTGIMLVDSSFGKI